MIIYLTGIDGSGKSTIADKLQNEIFADKKKILIWARYQPKLMNLLVFPFKKKFVSDKSKLHLMDEKQFSDWNLHKKKFLKNSFISSSLYFIQCIDYYFQYKQYIKKIEKYKDDIVILDRFLLDFLADESINYGDISKKVFSKFFLNKLRKIDFIFFIDVNEEIAFKRKSDIPSLDYYRGKKKFYEFYLARLNNSKIISNNGDINIAVNSIKDVILSKSDI